jgi:hypothetical protein
MEDKNMTVNSVERAWEEANKIMPNDYEQDMESSNRAGYPIYRSNVEYYDYICDLGDRLEVNLKDGSKSVNIWIVPEEQGEDVEVTVTATKTGEVRTYTTYAEFRDECRFFLSSGARSDSNEQHYEKIIRSLREIGEDDVKVETLRGGLVITFTYKKWSRR